MRIPKHLKKGDKIGLVCTARSFILEELEPALKLIEAKGYQAVIGETIGKSYHQYGGTDEERLKDFQMMIRNPEIRAIWICRGGYGTIRILDKIDFTGFMNDPKWIIGYSDVTVLHNYLNNFLGIASLHATMPINITGNTVESIETLFDLLEGKRNPLTFQKHPYNIYSGMPLKGKLIGGNLSILYSLLGTKTGFDTHQKILFLEDVGEYLYHIDRMMISLKNAQKLQQLKGLIVGGMTEMNDNAVPFGKSAEEIILEHTKEFGYPVIFGFPAGHITDNRALLMGDQITVCEAENEIILSYDLKNKQE